MKPNTLFSHFFFIILILLTLTSIPLYSAEKNSQRYEEIEWIQLMPKDDLDALLNPPDILLNIQDGSEQDSVEALSDITTQDDTVKRFQQALTSVNIIKSYDKKSVRIPGFIVPLKSDEQQRVTEFFIVPYFGACLHMPPPPPNQIIHGKIAKGFELSQLTEPFWFEGTVHIETITNATGTSAYGMAVDQINVFE